MQAMIIDITADNFQDMVVQNSHHVPVLVDFWAPWCGPCKQVMPMLEKLANDLAGRFILAKINTEEETALADQFQIRSVPTFKVFYRGEEVQELQGAQPLSAFQTALEPYLPKDPSEELRAEAQQAFAEGNYEQALNLLGQAAQANPNNFRIHLDLAKMYYQRGHIEKAQELMEKLPEEALQSSEGKALTSLFRFTEMVAEAAPLEEIQATLQQNPNDPEALYGLSGYLILNNQPEAALQTLLRLFSVDRDYREGIARKTLIELFDTLQNDHPDMVLAYRRKLQSLMF